MINLIAYTDGSCVKNKNGGWAFYLLGFKNRNWIVSGREKNTTNNRMEMNALLHLLLFVKNYKYFRLEVRADSTYVINGCTIWRKSWERKNMESVKNADLWKDIYSLLDKRVKFVWVKGHAGNIGNELVDKTCRKEASKENN